jgi:hypothetical protein
MATKTKTKPGDRASKSKGGRRAPVRVKRSSDLPWMPIATLVVLVVLAIGMIVYVVASNRPASQPATVAGIPCDHLEHTQVHYHAAVQIMYQGVITNLPANIGISGSPSSPSCYYWLHVHPANTNVIHIESPASDVFTLGQFFAVWKNWANANGYPAVALNTNQVATFKLTSGQTLVAYVDVQDGKGPQVYTGDPNSIVLKAHEVITLEITPPAAATPPAFTFTSGL